MFVCLFVYGHSKDMEQIKRLKESLMRRLSRRAPTTMAKLATSAEAQCFGTMSPSL